MDLHLILIVVIALMHVDLETVKYVPKEGQGHEEVIEEYFEEDHVEVAPEDPTNLRVDPKLNQGKS